MSREDAKTMKVALICIAIGAGAGIFLFTGLYDWTFELLKNFIHGFLELVLIFVTVVCLVFGLSTINSIVLAERKRRRNTPKEQ